jgi:hypothetical protein
MELEEEGVSYRLYPSLWTHLDFKENVVVETVTMLKVLYQRVLCNDVSYFEGSCGSVGIESPGYYNVLVDPCLSGNKDTSPRTSASTRAIRILQSSGKKLRMI